MALFVCWKSGTCFQWGKVSAQPSPSPLGSPRQRPMGSSLPPPKHLPDGHLPPTTSDLLRSAPRVGLFGLGKR